MKLNNDSNILIGEKFFLKPFTIKDIQKEYIEWLNDTTVNQHLELRFQKQTLKTAKIYINTFNNRKDKFLWGIYNLHDKKLIGTTSLYNMNKHHGFINISILIGNKSYWGTSATVETKTLVINYAFYQIKVRKVLASTYAVNMSMNFTLKKLGFELEGKLIQNRLLKNGKYCDEFKWGLLKNEWKKKFN